MMPIQSRDPKTWVPSCHNSLRIRLCVHLYVGVVTKLWTRKFWTPVYASEVAEMSACIMSGYLHCQHHCTIKTAKLKPPRKIKSPLKSCVPRDWTLDTWTKLRTVRFLVVRKEQSNHPVIFNEGHHLLYHAQPKYGCILAVPLGKAFSNWKWRDWVSNTRLLVSSSVIKQLHVLRCFGHYSNKQLPKTVLDSKWDTWPWNRQSLANDQFHGNESISVVSRR